MNKQPSEKVKRFWKKALYRCFCTSCLTLQPERLEAKKEQSRYISARLNQYAISDDECMP